VECPKCHKMVKVPGGQDEEFEVVEEDIEVVDDEIEVVEEDDFEVVEDKPKKSGTKERASSNGKPKKKARVVIADDDDEDEDYEEWPKKKKGKKKPPPKKNNKPLLIGISALVMVVAVVGAVFAFKGKGKSGSAGGGGGNASINWVKYDAPDGSYTAYFPNGKPDAKSMEALAKNDAQTVQQMKAMGFTFDAVTRVDSGKEFNVALMGMPQLMLAQAEKEFSKPIAKGRLNAGMPGMDAGEVLDSSTVTVGGKSAKQIFVKGDNGKYVFTRMFLAGGKLVLIAVESSSEIKVDDSVIQEFFSKFEWKI
jgi:hypothetical protein